MVPTFELGSREPRSGGLYGGAVHAACHMAPSEELSRLSIVQTMTEALEPLSFVHAFYEGGAAAFHRIDVWSDIDLYIVVDDGMVPDTFRVVERPRLAVTDPTHPRRVLARRLRDLPEILPTREGRRVPPRRPRGANHLRAGQVPRARNPWRGRLPLQQGRLDQKPPLDREAFVRGIHDHRRRLRERIELFGPFVEKELLRGHTLEALEFYRALVVPSLVGALRMRYGPRHYDFRMRYVHRELPPEVVRRLEGLAFVTDPEDLATKYRHARAWFDKAIEEVDEEQIRRDVAGTSK